MWLVALAFGDGFDIEVLAPSWPTSRQWQLLAVTIISSLLPLSLALEGDLPSVPS